MPTTPRKARLLLKEGKAKVSQLTPFTIQLKYATGETRQETTLGIDAGSKVVGLSVVREDGVELYASEATLRNDIPGLLADKRMYRRNRRSRLRYREPGPSNHKKPKGWIAPSTRHKIDSHLKLVADVRKILPITKIVAEVAAFDIQKIQNPDISGVEYQQGDQLGFWNVRAYVLHRDKHQCQGKKDCKNKRLQVHHIESRKTGGGSPGNLITLCASCHKALHAGKLKLNRNRKRSFKNETFMGIMRWAFFNKLKEIHPNVHMAFGYLTKSTRIAHNLPKSHANDAYCITGNLGGARSDEIFTQKFVRKSNRCLHKANFLKGGRRQANKGSYIVHGFRLFDKVEFNGQRCFVFGRRSNGYFDLRLLNGTKIHASANHRDLRLLDIAKTLLIERGMRIPPATLEVGVSCAK